MSGLTLSATSFLRPLDPAVKVKALMSQQDLTCRWCVWRGRRWPWSASSRRPGRAGAAPGEASADPRARWGPPAPRRSSCRGACSSAACPGLAAGPLAPAATFSCNSRHNRMSERSKRYILLLRANENIILFVCVFNHDGDQTLWQILMKLWFIIKHRLLGEESQSSSSIGKIVWFVLKRWPL